MRARRWLWAADVVGAAGTIGGAWVLSLPAALTADLMHQRSFAMIEVRGILARTSRGTIDAWLMNGQTGRAGAGGRSSPDAQDSIIGNFTLSVTEHRVPRWLSEGISVFEEWRTGPTHGIAVSPRALEVFSEGKFIGVEQIEEGLIS